MRDSLTGAAWRLSVFLVVCAFGTFALLTVFAQFRFGSGAVYFAEFTNVSGLQNGNMVRIAGVEVGTVRTIEFNEDGSLRVEFAVEDSVVLTDGSRAAIRYDNVIGGRYLALEEGAGGVRPLQRGDTIPTDRTAPALDLDSVIGGFKPLFRALEPDQVNALSGQLIAALQGQGPTITSFLDQATIVTNSLADRDELIGQVIDNLNVVLGSIGAESDRLDTAVGSLGELVHRLAERKTDVTNAIAYTDAAAGSIAELLPEIRAPFTKVTHEIDRAAAIGIADREYLENLIETLPDKYRVLARQGMYGDFFSFYLCEIVLKVNGKGGQPVYVKVAGQDSGRCAPR